MNRLTASVALTVLTASALTTTSSANAQETGSPLQHGVVFTRFLPGADQGEVYRIDARQIQKHLIRAGVLDYAQVSPDRRQLTDFAPRPNGRGSACVFNVNGSAYRTLPIADPTLELPGGTWLGNTRIVSGGYDPADPTRTGLYSRRSTDGGGLIRLTHAGTRVDIPIQSSPNGSNLLFFRPDARNETSDSAAQDLFVARSDGTRVTRLTPPGMTTAVVFPMTPPAGPRTARRLHWPQRRDPSGKPPGIRCTWRAPMGRPSNG